MFKELCWIQIGHFSLKNEDFDFVKCVHFVSPILIPLGNDALLCTQTHVYIKYVTAFSAKKKKKKMPTFFYSWGTPNQLFVKLVPLPKYVNFSSLSSAWCVLQNPHSWICLVPPHTSGAMLVEKRVGGFYIAWKF